MAKQAALVNMETREVENVGAVGSPAPYIDGKQFFYASMCAGGVLPTIGQIYQGDTPATFADPVPVDPTSDLADKSLGELSAELRALQARQTEILDAMDQVRG